MEAGSPLLVLKTSQDVGYGLIGRRMATYCLKQL